MSSLNLALNDNRNTQRGESDIRTAKAGPFVQSVGVTVKTSDLRQSLENCVILELKVFKMYSLPVACV